MSTIYSVRHSPRRIPIPNRPTLPAQGNPIEAIEGIDQLHFADASSMRVFVSRYPDVSIRQSRGLHPPFHRYAGSQLRAAGEGNRDLRPFARLRDHGEICGFLQIWHHVRARSRISAAKKVRGRGRSIPWVRLARGIALDNHVKMESLVCPLSAADAGHRRKDKGQERHRWQNG